MTIINDRFITLTQGEFYASRDPVVLSTVLGSCVAVCLFDPSTGTGGMNHFLLPDGGTSHDARSERYGVHAMEQLINAILRLGARRASLVAKAFGGANMSARLAPIGDANACFTREFLATEGIPCLAESFGGTNARRVMFWPQTGKAQQMIVPGTLDEPPPPLERSRPNVTLF
ncbi:chemotaxis protein CheD [Tabrizicola sp.]|uniref:chemotaxis protein CheD n=1 Tax=Tabrizicola sp. TaxID=2005166 RepID=UPI0035B03E1A